MNNLMSMICLGALLAGAYFLVRFIIATIRKQDKSPYLKKFIASVIVVVTASIGVYQTRTPEQIAAQQAKMEAENKAAEDKRLADVKAEEARKVAEQKIAEEKRLADIKAAEERKLIEAQQKQDEMLRDITTGWNLNTTDTDNDHINWNKATDLVRKYPDYIHTAEPNWISATDALKKPWDFYGKVVNLSGRIYSIEQLPPGNSVAQFFGGNCYHAMLAIGDGYDPVAVSMYIVGDSAHVAEDSTANVKGYIFGHAQLVNRMGGGSRGLAFVGFQE
ncbi:MAG: hypothetical protein IKD80_06090 [Selenomonadaceae bacterium]|nr:hypothetical protein [Selenomonadaceae bacterium]